MNEQAMIRAVNNQANEIEKLKAMVQKLNYENGKYKDTINSQSRTISNLDTRLAKLEKILARRLR